MSKHIILAEDHTELSAVIDRMLRDAGYSVTCANNGTDVLCLLSNEPRPDLLILDIVMPKVDGYEVLRRLEPTAPPVIVITGFSIDESQFDPGKVARVLSKPIDPKSFLKMVAEVLEAAPLKKEKQEEKAKAAEMIETVEINTKAKDDNTRAKDENTEALRENTAAVEQMTSKEP